MYFELGIQRSRGTLRLPMRNRFDHLAKDLGKAALGPSGTTVANETINPETQYVDLRHEPDPARSTERARLGLLGRFAAVPCLIEVYSRAPSAGDLRACLTKHLAFWHQRERTARSDSNKQSGQQQPSQASADPFLWIIAAGAPTTLLTRLKLEPAPAWPPGLYFFGADILRVGIVVACELPRDPTTLLVRLMAAGPLIAEATREVAELPPGAYERAIAEPILLSFQHLLEQDASRDANEQELIMTMYRSFDEIRDEGRATGWADALLDVLRVRSIAVPDATRERILAQRDQQQLKRWLEKAVVASSLEDVIGEPS
jgi:hypothetical protein